MSTSGPGLLPSDLGRDIDSCRYFPELVAATVSMALGEESVLAHLVHQEATFNRDEIQRHMSVLVLTNTRLLVSHTDENNEPGKTGQALTTTESVPLSTIKSVALSQVVGNAEAFGAGGSELVETWLAVSWGTMSRIDLEPAQCADPSCEADHGLTGVSAADDLTVRISAAGDGPDKVAQLVAFATALQRLSGGAA